MTTKTTLRRIASLTVGACLALALVGCGESEPPTQGADAQFRRLTEEQYRNSIADIFGRGIVIAGRFDPLERIEGLLAVGAGQATITPAALERYEALGRSIALQVVSENNRSSLIPCQPADASTSNATCATEFLNRAGKFLFRRPLTESETSLYVGLANDSAETLSDFYSGLAYGLTGMLVSPKYLYITDTIEPDPDEDGVYQLDAYAKAARLSFLLWNTTPDAALLAAAETGELNTDKGLENHFNRMISSPRAEAGLRAFFGDMLEFERFETMEKDPVIYPAFNIDVAEDAREQTLRTLTHHLLDEEADYRDLFTTRSTFMSGPLGVVYRVPVDEPDGWTPYEFPENSPWAGVQTQLSFVSLFSHPGKSSPTLRGQAVREHLLCQKIPEPPGDVDFSDFNDDSNPVNRTARQRLDVHNQEPSCAGCHKLMDPIGLALEQFDGAGQFRTTENEVVIDTTGELDGIPYEDAIGLGQALRDNPSATSCVTNRLYSYAAGRLPVNSERQWIAYLEQRFAEEGYKVPALLREIVLSDAFYRVVPPDNAVTSAQAGDGRGEEENKS